MMLHIDTVLINTETDNIFCMEIGKMSTYQLEFNIPSFCVKVLATTQRRATCSR